MVSYRVLGYITTYKLPGLSKYALKSLSGVVDKIVYAIVDYQESNEDLFSECFDLSDEVIKYRSNIGYCKAINVALSYAIEEGYDFVLVLNSDAMINQDTIPEIISHMDTCKHIVAQPMIVKIDEHGNKTDLLDCAGIMFEYGENMSFERGYGKFVSRWIGKKIDEIPEVVDEVPAVSGAVSVYNLRAVKRVGYLWERLWSLCDEMEYGWRAYKHGYRCLYVGTVEGYHFRCYSCLCNVVSKELERLWRSLEWRNTTLIYRRHGSEYQIRKTYECLCPIIKENTFPRICVEALVNDNLYREMEKKVRELFISAGVSSVC